MIDAKDQIPLAASIAAFLCLVALMAKGWV